MASHSESRHAKVGDAIWLSQEPSYQTKRNALTVLEVREGDEIAPGERWPVLAVKRDGTRVPLNHGRYYFKTEESK